MELDYDRAEEKKKEIISTLSSMLHSNIGLEEDFDQISNKVFSSCISSSS